MRVFVGLVGTWVGMAAASGAVWASHRGQPPAALRAGATPVVVELFSSEGCSSCPPADTWLASVDRAQTVDGVAVLALEEHVDYWDRLGWRDPFAQPQFGDRQHDYARALHDRSVYTPQIIIDGHAVVENGDENQAFRDLRASAGEARAKVAIAKHGDRVTVDVSDIPSDGSGSEEPAEVWFAITESGLATNVAAGENAGRRLAHAPVVRVLRKIGVATASGFHGETDGAAAPSWSPRSLRIVAFVQRARSHRIVGAGSL